MAESLLQLVEAWRESPEYPERKGAAAAALSYAFRALEQRGYTYGAVGASLGWNSQKVGRWARETPHVRDIVRLEEPTPSDRELEVLRRVEPHMATHGVAPAGSEAKQARMEGYAILLTATRRGVRVHTLAQLLGVSDGSIQGRLDSAEKEEVEGSITVEAVNPPVASDSRDAVAGAILARAFELLEVGRGDTPGPRPGQGNTRLSTPPRTRRFTEDSVPFGPVASSLLSYGTAGRDRATRAHHRAVRRISRAAEERGLDVEAVDRQQDACFRVADVMVNIEVKTLQSGLGAQQFRLGLGQVLDQCYQHYTGLAHERNPAYQGVVRILPVLAVDTPARPRDWSRWAALTAHVGVLLLTVDDIMERIFGPDEFWRDVAAGLPSPLAIGSQED